MFFLTKEKKSKNQNKSYEFFRKKGVLNKFSGSSWYKNIDSFLKESDYYIGMDLYIFIHITFLILIIYAIFTKTFTKGIIVAIETAFKVILVTVLPVNMLIYFKGKQRQNKIQLELCNIQETIYFQTKIGTPEDVVIANTSMIANEPLKTPLEDLASAYRLKRNIKEKLKEIRNISKLIELKTFTFILEQKQVSGESEESHRAQSNMMKRNRRLRKKIMREYKRTKLIVSALLLFTCYVLMLSVPLFQSTYRAWQQIFR